MARQAPMTRLLAHVRLVHVAPALAVTVLSTALALIIGAEVGGAAAPRVALVALAVAGSQVWTGALNDWADRDRDAAAGRRKPIVEGEVAPRAALAIAVGGLAVQVAASAPLGALPLALGLVASASAAAYDLRLSRTPLSVLPYLVSFGILPAWLAAGVGAPIERVLPAIPLVAPFAAAAHLANLNRDFAEDRATGSRSLAQVLGERTSHAMAVGLALLVGVGVGAALVLGGRGGAPVVAAGLVGLAAVISGVGSPGRLWRGMLVAAVAWTVAWGLATAGA